MRYYTQCGQLGLDSVGIADRLSSSSSLSTSFALFLSLFPPPVSLKYIPNICLRLFLLSRCLSLLLSFSLFCSLSFFPIQAHTQSLTLSTIFCSFSFSPLLSFSRVLFPRLSLSRSLSLMAGSLARFLCHPLALSLSVCLFPHSLTISLL